MNNYLPSKKGDIVDVNSHKVVGHHDGVLYYTIGQRKGLGIGGIKGIDPKSWFVVAKDVKNNILYVSQGDDNEYLLSDRALISNINWINMPKPTNSMHVGCKFRYRQQDNFVTLKFIDDDIVELIYDEPIKSVTPGQAAVFYDGDIMLGGGIIDRVFYKEKEKMITSFHD